MHDAYVAIPILKGLPLAIECIACWSEQQLVGRKTAQNNHNDAQVSSRIPQNLPKATLLIGTKPGHLLVYSIQHNPATNKADVQLERSNRSFSKKPIQQLFVCLELKLILSISDSVLSVHDLSTFQLITCLQRSKGANCFSADLESRTSSQGETAHTLRLCIAVKRKLQLYFWKNRDFYELSPDLTMPDIPRCLAWCRDSVCLGFRREYYIVQVKANAEPKELFQTGKGMEPVISKLDENRLVLVKDDMSIFIDSTGTPTEKHVFKWSDVPVSIETQTPYILAVLPFYVEVRTLEPRLQIQNVEVVKPKFICSWKEWVFVASVTHIWGLVQVPIARQIEQLLREKQFELALRLAKLTEEDEEERTKRIKHIQNLLAFDLFCQARFEESLKNFSKLGTDPAQVIGLYPDLLPADFQKILEYPSAPPSLHGSQLEKGLLALIEYLTEKRNETIVQSVLPPAIPIVEGNRIIRSRNSLLLIIDTTLLKCYLKTNDALLAPLLRLPDNFCHVEECEKVLRKAKKYRELIILYRKKNLHRKALNLLVSQKVDNVIETHEATIEYLQHLGKDHLQLIFEFAPWIFKVSEEDGLRIFTEDMPEIESLPKKPILEFLASQSSDIAIKYLEHLVNDLHDKTPDFHNRLVSAYRVKVQSLMELHRDSLPEVDRYSLNNGPPELREMRAKLLNFLDISTSYQAERLLPEFTSEDMVEERAILLGRTGMHEQALAIYAQKLRTPERAEEYCHRVYELDPIMNKDVFLCLLKMYLPFNGDADQASGYDSAYTNHIPKPDIAAALRVLEQHSSKIDPVQALQLLPERVDIRKIRSFLEDVLEKLNERHREVQVLKSLMLSESYQIHEQRMFHENHKCIITDERVCRVCKKKIGDSAFARYPNDVVVHYFCCKNRKVLPMPTP